MSEIRKSAPLPHDVYDLLKDAQTGLDVLGMTERYTQCLSFKAKWSIIPREAFEEDKYRILSSGKHFLHETYDEYVNRQVMAQHHMLRAAESDEFLVVDFEKSRGSNVGHYVYLQRVNHLTGIALEYSECLIGTVGSNRNVHLPEKSNPLGGFTEQQLGFAVLLHSAQSYLGWQPILS